MTVLGSKVVVECPVDSRLVLVDGNGIATEMQMARETKRKTAKDESFIVFLWFYGFVIALGGEDKSRWSGEERLS